MRMIKRLAGTVAFALIFAVSAQAQNSRVAADIRMTDEAMRVAAERPATVMVNVRLNGEQLWSGRLRVGAQGNANYSQNVNEYADPCPGDTSAAARYRTRSDNMNISVRRQVLGDGAEEFVVDARRTYALPGCGDPGADSVGLRRSARLAPGESVVFSGVGDLRVELSRLD